MNRRILAFALALAALAACGSDDPCAGVSDLLASPGGLALTEAEHPAGWGRSDCMLCHQAAAIHTASCASAPVDLAAVREEADPEDTRTCVACHGANGVEAWAELEEEPGDTGE